MNKYRIIETGKSRQTNIQSRGEIYITEYLYILQKKVSGWRKVQWENITTTFARNNAQALMMFNAILDKNELETKSNVVYEFER